jgi:hypothetical protein
MNCFLASQGIFPEKPVVELPPQLTLSDQMRKVARA